MEGEEGEVGMKGLPTNIWAGKKPDLKVKIINVLSRTRCVSGPVLLPLVAAYLS